MTYLLAQAATPEAPLWVSFAPMILIFLIFYFIWFRPIRQKQKNLEQLVSELKKGDKVVTNGGFYGEIVKAEGAVVVLKLADNVKVRVAKRAIAGLEGSSEDKGGN